MKQRLEKKVEQMKEDATQSENEINIARMVHFNSEDKENPAQPSA